MYVWKNKNYIIVNMLKIVQKFEKERKKNTSFFRYNLVAMLRGAELVYSI